MGKQRVDRSDLHAAAAAFVSQFRRVHMILTIRDQERGCTEAFQDCLAILRTSEAL